MSNRGRNKNEIMKCENIEKDGWVENCRKEISSITNWVQNVQSKHEF